MATSNERRRAYEAGFRGDPAPDWAAGNSDLLAEYDRGLQDGEDPAGAAAAASERARQQRSKSGGTATKTRKRTSSSSSTSTTPGAPASSTSSAAPASSTSSGGSDELRGGAGMPRPGDLPGAHIGGGFTVDDGAGFLLGLFVFALGRAFLVGGSSLAKAWLKAKFLNEPAASSWGGGTSDPSANGGAWGGGTGSTTTQGDYSVPSSWNATPAAPKYPAVPWTPTTPAAGSTAKTATIPGNFVGGQQ